MKRFALAALLALSAVSLAELPPLSREELAKEATHVVTGKVQAVYSFDERKEKDWVDTRFVAEILVESVDKGESLQKGKLVYVRGWDSKQRPDGWVGPGGHGIPAVGARVQVYFSRGEDGGCGALLPNGFEEPAK